MVELPSSQSYFERFEVAARRHGADQIALPFGGSIACLGEGSRLAVLTGLHGNEPSGPLAVLKWFEETPPGSLIPPGQSLCVAPLVNTLGWDNSERLWNELDLNRSFAAEKAPDFLKSLMECLINPLPTLYIDLHEDHKATAPYFFVYTNDTHDLSQRLAAALEANLVPWEDVELWHGSSEVYIREMGCARAVTTEAPGMWPVEARTNWQLKSILWCRDNLISFAKDHIS